MSYIGATLAKDPASTRQEAAIEIYRKVRPGEPLILENAEALVDEFIDQNSHSEHMKKLPKEKLLHWINKVKPFKII